MSRRRGPQEGVIVLRFGRECVWDAAHGSLQPYLGAQPTVFRDADEAEFHIRKTVERWPEAARAARSRVFEVLA